MTLEIFNLQTHFLENIWRRNVDRKPDKNSPSNILWIFALFKRYFQKYESSRRHFLLRETLSANGLRCFELEGLYANWDTPRHQRSQGDGRFLSAMWLGRMSICYNTVLLAQYAAGPPAVSDSRSEEDDTGELQLWSIFGIVAVMCS